MSDAHAAKNELPQEALAQASSASLPSMTDVESRMSADDVSRINFKQSRNHVKSGRAFTFITLLYGERKILVTFLLHFVGTMVIWAHFALIKFNEQAVKVPEGAPHYWWKRLAPTLEFGSMHAILFQMALIPLTMSRLSIAVASTTVLERLIPFNRMVRFHIHLGYTFISIVFLATVFFFAFFGLLCSEGEAEFCAKFTSEIMITGYFILAFLLIVGFSSYFRDRIKYEIFYGLHHLVFIMYAVTTAHTLDVVQRTGERNRSQTFKWFSATILYYLCDRTAMHMNHRYITSITASSAVTSSKGTRMAIIKLNRPTMFHFKPGQYCMLRIPSIDRHWHPFSIASGPDSDYLEFYMEVYGETSWANKLWSVISERKVEARASGYILDHRSICIEVKGPYGTSLGKTEEYSHALAIGSGTGIVPILSLLKQHVYQIRRLDHAAYKREKAIRDRKMLCLHLQKKKMGLPWGRRHEDSGGSFGLLGGSAHQLSKKDLGGNGHDELSPIQIKKESARAIRSIYGAVAALFLPALGVTCIGFTFSWNALPFESYPGMDNVLQAGTIVFQALFAAVAIIAHDKSHFLTFVDAVIAVISVFADWYWFAKGLWANFSSTDSCNYLILVGYMTLRIWYTTVNPSKRALCKDIAQSGVPLDKLSFVWVARSADLVSKIMPDIAYLWEILCAAWGEDAAADACRISICVTDKDERACAALAAEVNGSPLGKLGAVRFERPCIRSLLEEHTIDRINDPTAISSNTLLAFCGSPQLSACIHRAKVENDTSTAISGHSLHQMEFISESYGATKSGRSVVYAAETDASAQGEEQRGTIKHQPSVRVNKIYRFNDGEVSIDDEFIGRQQVLNSETDAFANEASYEVFSV